MLRCLIGTLLLVGCYDVPHPECGFACGPGGACPDGYTCDQFSATSDYRCHPPDVPGSIDPMACPPAMASEDPRPRVSRNTLESTFPIDPTLTGFSLELSDVVSGIDEATLRLRSDDGARVPIDISLVTDTVVQIRIDRFTLTENVSYAITLEGEIFDSHGYRLVPYEYLFDVGRDQAPFILGRAPEIDATGVSVKPFMYVELNETLFELDPGDFELRHGARLVPVEMRVPDPGYPAFTITPTKQLLAGTVYTANLRPGFVDIGGNTFAGESWTFTTGLDVIPPSVVTVPEPGQLGVLVDRNVVLTFDEDVAPMETMFIALERDDGTMIDASVTYNTSSFVAFINPALQLAPRTTYRVRLVSVRDAAGLSPDLHSFTFDTGEDTIGPRVTWTSPAAASTNASRSGPLAIAFDEAVLLPDAGDFVVTVPGSNIAGTATATSARSWQFAPDAALPAGTPIRVQIVVTDEYDNVASYSYELTTGP